MTVKSKKAKKKENRLQAAGARTARERTAGVRSGKIARLRASVDDELIRLAEEDGATESRWNRPRKQSLSLRVDCEVVDWFKSKGPGYQTRINRILRRVMVEGKKRAEGK